MTGWWQERTVRERLLIGTAGGLLALILLWQFVLNPIAAYHDEARRAYEAAQSRLDQMAAWATEAADLKARNDGRDPQPDGGSLRSLVTASAQARGLVLARLQPGEDGALTLWIDEAEAKLLYGWIVQLQEDHGIGVTRASLTANEGASTVRAQLQLKQSNGGAP